MERLPAEEGGRTIAEVFDQRTELGGTNVRVRAKVVKVTENVMGKNWVHLRDGTAGTDGSDDLTVTTAATVRLGDVVVASGNLALDRTFGHGYTYPVLLEDATLSAE